MSQYRIAANGRLYYCDAANIAAALRHFHDNVEGADPRTIIEIGGLITIGSAQAIVDAIDADQQPVHQPIPKAARKLGRRAGR